MRLLILLLSVLVAFCWTLVFTLREANKLQQEVDRFQYERQDQRNIYYSPKGSVSHNDNGNLCW